MKGRPVLLSVAAPNFFLPRRFTQGASAGFAKRSFEIGALIIWPCLSGIAGAALALRVSTLCDGRIQESERYSLKLARVSVMLGIISIQNGLTPTANSGWPGRRAR